MRFNILFASFLTTAILLAFSCHKDDGNDEFGLPKPTQEGRGTFTVILNGKKWEPCMDLCLLCTPDPPILCYNYGARELYLEAQNFCGDDKRAITIYADSIDYDNKVYGWGAKFGDYSKNCGLDFYLDTTANNYLRITRFDGHIHGVMSAEFEFTFLNKTCPTMDTIKLQGGRFDVRVDF